MIARYLDSQGEFLDSFLFTTGRAAEFVAALNQVDA